METELFAIHPVQQLFHNHYFLSETNSDKFERFTHNLFYNYDDKSLLRGIQGPFCRCPMSMPHPPPPTPQFQ